MIPLTPPQSAALAAGVVVRRFFIWCAARNPITGAPDPAGFWDDVGDVTVEDRLYRGSGKVISLSSLAAKGDMTIPGLEVTLSGVDAAATALLGAKSIGQAPIDIKLGLFNPVARLLLPPLVPYFVGFVDDVDGDRPAAGGDSTIIIKCESASRALTKRGTATRSPASCRVRDAGDGFYDYTAVQRVKPLYWGQKDPTPAKPVRPGIR